jgi:hypothetical protein
MLIAAQSWLFGGTLCNFQAGNMQYIFNALQWGSINASRCLILKSVDIGAKERRHEVFMHQQN